MAAGGNEAAYPLGGYRFDLYIGNNTEIAASFSSCTGFHYRSQSQYFRFGDDTITGGTWISIGVDFSDISFSRAVEKDKDLFNNTLTAGHDFAEGPDVFKGSEVITLKVRDHAGNVGLALQFEEAGLVGYELSPMDAMKSDVLTEKFTFAFRTVKRISEG